VLEGLRGEDSIAELCRKEGIAQSLYYVWSKEFMEAGKRRLAGDTARAATTGEVQDLRREARALKECVADLTLENRLLKKSMIADGERRRMRYPASEKLEIIRIVEQSHLPAKRTLDQLGMARRTFYRWYDRYLEGGPEALEDRPSAPSRVWNRIGDDIQEQIIEMALEDERPISAPRTGGALHRREALLRVGSHGLPAAQGPRPDHQPGLCRDQGRRCVPHQDHPAQRDVADRLHLLQDHRLGLDVSVDRARRLLALHHRLEAVHHMRAEDVTDTLDMALAASGCDMRTVLHKPRLLSDNGPSYIAGELAEYIEANR
jgi:putative transposase